MKNHAPGADGRLQDDLLTLDNQVCFALYALNRAVTGRYRPLLAELDLTYPQYLVMLVMWEADGRGETPRVSEIGERLRLDSGTLTPLLRRLEQRGLITRRRSPEDERVVTVALAEAGAELHDRARKVPERLLCELGMDAAEAGQLRDDLRALLNRLEEST
ncbi:DNA-binding transcriptional regulator, MarR family [Marinobacter daqiaonensis]|uniref:DNA-binding transcriptional regulator, MarR family n=1 Tax=Marinobacter daqiaonensis TaxID=650891 RepID=A0A1I6H252_9GAMM|nr:MarR family transcriptional regulator [Marinobacter daqiaonensis]SFR48575.1 DNA-binding transcriptional regulator, MarR family [Marinobacter daqiaonensis]